jgi:hypothetical protein
MQWSVTAFATAAIAITIALTAYNPHEKTTQPTIATTGLTPNSVISTEAQRSGVVISTGPRASEASRRGSGEIAAFFCRLENVAVSDGMQVSTLRSR